MTERKEKQLAALRRLASVLGAELLIEERDDVVEAAAEVARRQGHHLHLRRRVAAAARAGAAARAVAAAADARHCPPASTCGSSPTGEIGGRGRARRRTDMSPIEALLIALGLALAGGGGFLIARRRLAGPPSTRVHQILLPFTGQTISRRALDAALRLAKAENATLMPAYLAIVPMHLPLDDTACPGRRPSACRCSRRSSSAPPRRAFRSTLGSSVGRSYRHALLRLLENETVDRVSRLGHRPAAGRILRRGPRLAAPGGPGRGLDPAPRPRGHAGDLGQQRQPAERCPPQRRRPAPRRPPAALTR